MVFSWSSLRVVLMSRFILEDFYNGVR
jgi:hypothetical protein